MDYLAVKWLHIVSSTLLFGTGIGSAYYLLFTSLTKDVRAIAVVSRLLVVADLLFTATTAVLQPLTGWWLARTAGLPLGTGWLAASIVLYAIAIGCWLPVVWMQVRMRDIAAAALDAGTELPPAYWRYLRLWTALGVPALAAFIAIFWLMVHKPV